MFYMILGSELSVATATVFGDVYLALYKSIVNKSTTSVK